MSRQAREERGRLPAEAECDAVKSWRAVAIRSPLLSAEDEKLLVRQMADTSHPERAEQARQKLIESNLRLALSVAKNYRGQGMAYSDIIQEANIGLIYAVESYDGTKGHRFSTYATYSIRRAIQRAFDTSRRAIRLPSWVQDQCRCLSRAESAFAEKCQREPNLTELADASGLTEERIVQLRQHQLHVYSLDYPTYVNDQDGTVTRLAEFVEASRGGEDPVIHVESNAEAEEALAALARLPYRYRQTLILRYGLADGVARTLDEVACLVGLSHTSIHNREVKALKQLRFLLGHPERSNTHGNHGDD